MVHGLAQQSGGFLELKSTVGVGTTAEIWLPVTDAETATALTVGEANSAERRQGLRVLAVDDDSLVLMNTVAMLEELGHEVFEAHSGPETGAELADKVRTAWPDLPILVATGYAELPESTARHLPRLAKPFGQEDLISAIATTLGGGAENRMRSETTSA